MSFIHHQVLIVPLIRLHPGGFSPNFMTFSTRYKNWMRQTTRIWTGYSHSCFHCRAHSAQVCFILNQQRNAERRQNKINENILRSHGKREATNFQAIWPGKMMQLLCTICARKKNTLFSFSQTLTIHTITFTAWRLFFSRAFVLSHFISHRFGSSKKVTLRLHFEHNKTNESLWLLYFGGFFFWWKWE